MKKNILLIFGGQSSEHEISIKSAINVIKLIDKNKYNLFMVGITKDGEWKLVKDITEMENATWLYSKIEAILSPSAKDKALIIKEKDDYYKQNIDLVFPVLHGLYGEDGSIQGLFELAQIPYVGCGIIASSLAMDKTFTKIIVDTLNIRQAKYVSLNKRDILADINKCIQKIEEKISYPMFVKPSNAGSSIGINKANNKDELQNALNIAIMHDNKVLVEEFIKAREIECAILSYDNEVKASVLGEIKAAADFYDFDAKYNNPDSLTIVNPELEESIITDIQDKAIRIFKALDGYGLSRVDFFVNDKNEVIFNEINTIPGFTQISMYPMLWEATNIDKYKLVDILIEQAFKRY